MNLKNKNNQKYKMTSIEEILRNHYVEGAFHTHVSLIQPKGKFQFNRVGLEKFWDIYCSTILDEKCIVGIAEKPQNYLPVLADIDLKIKDENIEYGDHLYSEKQCMQIIKIYQTVLKQIVENCNDNNLLCVLLEKPIYYISVGETLYAKNGFHLHFPNIFLTRADQEVHLLPRIQNLAKDMNIFSNLGIEDSSTVIDKAACKNHWLLYGSRKSEDMEPYKISKIITSNGANISLEQAFNNYKIYDSSEKALFIKGKINENLPRILSIIPWNRETNEIKKGIPSILKDKIHEKSKKEYNKISVSVSESLSITEILLPMIADWRSSDYQEWISIGWILFNIGEGCSQALDLWLSFSSRCNDKYDESNCIYLWGQMTKKKYTIGTLHFLAKKDSPDKYKEYVKEKTTEKIKDSLDGSHNDIAKVLYEEYKNEFVCASISNKIWYQFRNNIWQEIEEGIYLREKISNDIVHKYIEQAQLCFTKMGQSTDKVDDASIQNRLKQIQKIIGNLKSSPYKNNVMKEAMEVFYDRNFKQLLDKDKYLIAFKNGIYDLNLNKFRNGIPEDYISKCIPIDYTEYDESDEEVQNVIDFLQKVFPDSSVRTYFLDTYSDIFVGGNTQKKVYLWTGEGDNGKSITQSFFDKMLGELAVKFNTQYFTGKKVSTGSANPELARAAPPVRHVTMEEPDADESLNIGELKKLSGGDTYWARDLFESGKNSREVEPMFTLTFICNKLPRLKYSDKATWNRLRVIPFESTFVDSSQPCPKTFEEQMLEKRFPMDKNFSNKIPGMISAFAWYLLKWRQKITFRIEPQKVLEATEVYRRQNDIYRQYIEECIYESVNSIVTLTDIYSSFKEWYKEGFSASNVPIKNEVKEYFEKLWGECEKCKWKGYKIKSFEEDLNDGSAIILNESDLVND